MGRGLQVNGVSALPVPATTAINATVSGEKHDGQQVSLLLCVGVEGAPISKTKATGNAASQCMAGPCRFLAWGWLFCWNAHGADWPAGSRVGLAKGGSPCPSMRISILGGNSAKAFCW